MSERAMALGGGPAGAGFGGGVTHVRSGGRLFDEGDRTVLTSPFTADYTTISVVWKNAASGVRRHESNGDSLPFF